MKKGCDRRARDPSTDPERRADHKNQISLSGYSCHSTVMTWVAIEAVPRLKSEKLCWARTHPLQHRISSWSSGKWLPLVDWPIRRYTGPPTNFVSSIITTTLASSLSPSVSINDIIWTHFYARLNSTQLNSAAKCWLKAFDSLCTCFSNDKSLDE